MRQVLGELELLSHGPSQRLDPSGAGGDGEGAATVPDPPHTVWRKTYEKCDHDLERQRVIVGAREALNGWRGYGRTVPANLPSDGAILDARILEHPGTHAPDVAVHLRTTTTRVRKVRVAAGRTADLGLEPVPIDDSLGQEDRVRALDERGMTLGQIVALTGVAKSTVRRILGRLPSGSAV